MSKLFTTEQWESFKWRVWNTLRSIIFPIVLGTVLVTLENYGSFEGIFKKEVWINIAYSVAVALIGSALARIRKSYQNEDSSKCRKRESSRLKGLTI